MSERDLFKEWLPSVTGQGVKTKDEEWITIPYLGDDEDAINDSKYPRWMMTHSLSTLEDCVLLANELSIRSGVLDNKMHYDFLYHAIPKRRKRPYFQKSKRDSKDVELVMRVYGYSRSKAEEALSILGTLDLVEMEREWVEGGK